MISTQNGVPAEDVNRPETSKCSRVERSALNRTQTNFASEMTKQSVQLSKGVKNAGSSSNQTQPTENNMNGSQQGFYQRQNSFSKGMTLDQYFNSTAQSGNFPQNPNPQAQKEELIEDKEVSEQSEYLNDHFEIHQQEDEYSQSNRDSRLQIDGHEGGVGFGEGFHGESNGVSKQAQQIEEREPRFSEAQNSITNENQNNRDNNIQRKIRQKYTQRARHKSYNPNTNLLHGNPVMSTSTGVNVGGGGNGSNGGNSNGNNSGNNSVNSAYNVNPMQTHSHTKSSSMRDTNSNWKEKQPHYQRESMRLQGEDGDHRNNFDDQDDMNQQGGGQDKFSQSFYMRKANKSQSPRNKIFLQNQGSKEINSENSQSSINHKLITTQYNDKFMNKSIVNEQQLENYQTERSIENHIAFRNSFYSKEFLVKNGILGPFNSSFYNGVNNSQNRLTNQDFYKNGMGPSGNGGGAGNPVGIGANGNVRNNDQYEDSIMRQTAKENQFLLQKEKINELIEKEDNNLVNQYAAHFNLQQEECNDLQKGNTQYGYIQGPGGGNQAQNSGQSQGNQRIETPNYGFRSQFNGMKYQQQADQQQHDNKLFKRNDN